MQRLSTQPGSVLQKWKGMLKNNANGVANGFGNKKKLLSGSLLLLLRNRATTIRINHTHNNIALF